METTLTRIIGWTKKYWLLLPLAAGLSLPFFANHIDANRMSRAEEIRMLAPTPEVPVSQMSRADLEKFYTDTNVQIDALASHYYIIGAMLLLILIGFCSVMNTARTLMWLAVSVIGRLLRKGRHADVFETVK